MARWQEKSIESLQQGTHYILLGGRVQNTINFYAEDKIINNSYHMQNLVCSIHANAIGSRN